MKVPGDAGDTPGRAPPNGQPAAPGTDVHANGLRRRARSGKMAPTGGARVEQGNDLVEQAITALEERYGAEPDDTSVNREEMAHWLSEYAGFGDAPAGTVGTAVGRYLSRNN